MNRPHPVWIFVLSFSILAAGIRLRTLSVALERDEGEYAFAGRLMLEGVPPYAEVYNMKMPGIYAAYALVLATFGETSKGIHAGLLLIHALTCLLLFLLGRMLLDFAAGAAAAGAFAILALAPSVQGFSAHAEHFVLLPALAGIVLLVHSVRADRRLLVPAAGILLGLAFLMKQHGLVFLVFGVLYLFLPRSRGRAAGWARRLGEAGILAGCALLPFAVACLLLARAGVFGRFRFWTFEYAPAYVSQLPLSLAPEIFHEKITAVIGTFWPIWVLAAVGFASPLWNTRARKQAPFLALFLLCSFLSVCPGFYFREHYFVLLLPAVALNVGIAASVLRERLGATRSGKWNDAVPAVLVILALSFPVFRLGRFFLSFTPLEISRAVYGTNPFPESAEIAKHVRDNTPPSARIAVFGSEPQIYFYSGRRSATGHIYTYGLMEAHPFALQMQEEMIREITEARPEYVIAVNIRTSWLALPESQKKIFGWFNGYIEGFELEGLVEIPPEGAARYIWGAGTSDHTPAVKDWVAIYRRRSTG